MVSKTYKNKNGRGNRTKGWGKVSPKRTRTRTRMMKRCGKKCFLGPNKSFPICNKGTCKINSKGVYSAYIRARQWGKPRTTYKTSKPTHSRKVYTKIQRKSKNMLKNRFGIIVNK